VSSINTIIFDLDGTLIDSASSILAGFDYVLKINGISPLKRLTPSLIGPPLIPTIRMLSGNKKKKKLHEMAIEFKDY
jgi:phosphoglycolate phosphatase